MLSKEILSPLNAPRAFQVYEVASYRDHDSAPRHGVSSELEFGKRRQADLSLSVSESGAQLRRKRFGEGVAKSVPGKRAVW